MATGSAEAISSPLFRPTPLRACHVLPDDVDELFAPDALPPDPKVNIFGRRRPALQGDGDLPNRPEITVHHGPRRAAEQPKAESRQPKEEPAPVDRRREPMPAERRAKISAAVRAAAARRRGEIGEQQNNEASAIASNAQAQGRSLSLGSACPPQDTFHATGEVGVTTGAGNPRARGGALVVRQAHRKPAPIPGPSAPTPDPSVSPPLCCMEHGVAIAVTLLGERLAECPRCGTAWECDGEWKPMPPCAVARLIGQLRRALCPPVFIDSTKKSPVERSAGVDNTSLSRPAGSGRSAFRRPRPRGSAGQRPEMGSGERSEEAPDTDVNRRSPSFSE